MTHLKLIAVAASLAIALPAMAQTQAPVDPALAPAAADTGVNTSTGPVPADQLPPAQAQALAAGDNTHVTNGPVPDTPANRAKYGRPMSNAGRRTAPAGN
jgi:hypothetical protein